MLSGHTEWRQPQRDRLQRDRYLLRPPLALERLTQSSGGQLLSELPHPRRDAPGVGLDLPTLVAPGLGVPS
jgi:hypothetical protein